MYLCTEKLICALKNIFMHRETYFCTKKTYPCTEKYICALENMPVT